MSDDPIKRALSALIALCVVILVVAVTYYVGEYRARAKDAPSAVALPDPILLGGEPAEAGGIEGTATQQGILITSLDGRARGWGLVVGDVIRRIADQPARYNAQLSQLGPGVGVEVRRNGQAAQFTLGNSAGAGTVDVRPIEARGLSGQLTPEGLWVSSVEGEAALWGLRRGDLIRSVNGRPLTVRRDGALLLSTLNPWSGLVFDVVRGGARVSMSYGGNP